MYSGRLEATSDIGDILRAIFRAQGNAFKINLSFGLILSNVETGEKRYYYPSQNGLIFDQPLVVADEADLQIVLLRVGETDFLEYVRQQKPNSKWCIALLINVAFYQYLLVDRPIGRGKITGQLPKRLIENRGSGCTGKRPADWQVICRPLVLFSMLGAASGLRFPRVSRECI